MNVRVLVAALLTLSVSSGAVGQDEPIEGSQVSQPSEADQARALFEQAAELLQDDRFAEARDLLRRSLAMHPSTPSAYNLAVALRGTGEILDALELFERLLAGDFGSLPEAREQAARETLEEIRGEVGRIALHACGAESIQARIDGERAAMLTDCETRTVSVDPGRHVVLFSAEYADSIERTVQVERGEREAVNAQLVVRQPPLVESRGVGRSPWFWTAIAVVVGGGVAAAVLLSRDRTADLVTDDTGGVIFALRR